MTKGGRKQDITAAVRRHWQAVADTGCIITQCPAQIAHSHGGSISDMGLKSGMGLRGVSHYLVLPLAPHLALELDGGNGVRAWEEIHGNQTDLLDRLSIRRGYSVWELAEVDR